MNHNYIKSMEICIIRKRLFTVGPKPNGCRLFDVSYSYVSIILYRIEKIKFISLNSKLGF